MKTGNEGFQQCYNAQAAVDAEHQLVVATDVTANASDQGGLPVLLDAVPRAVRRAAKRCWPTRGTATSGT